MSLDRLTKLLISALFYACNILWKIEYAVTVLLSRSHYINMKIRKVIWLCIITISFVRMIQKSLDFMPVSESIFPISGLKLCLVYNYILWNFSLYMFIKGGEERSYGLNYRASALLFA